MTVSWVVVITLMLEAASTSEMLVNFYQTIWYNNPQDSHLHVTVFSYTSKYYSCIIREA
jgi:hypothetical protein